MKKKMIYDLTRIHKSFYQVFNSFKRNKVWKPSMVTKFDILLLVVAFLE